jgi:predicted NAD/FAD-binding protein
MTGYEINDRVGGAAARASVALDPSLKRVAIVGAGVSGLGAAYSLQQSARVHVTLYEKAPTFGGHAHTVDVTLPGLDGGLVTAGVDTGFLVYNERTYPKLIRLLGELGVPTARSDMSFSVQAPAGLRGSTSRLEWSGSSLSTVFAQRRNMASPSFWWMLIEILRFNRLATALAVSGEGDALNEPVGDFLARNKFGEAFREGYLLPMIGCIWSCPLEQMLRFPIATLIRFCHNHGLLQVNDRPAWHTVAGGSRRYVDAILRQIRDARPKAEVTAVRRSDSGVWITVDGAEERFDAVVMACHAPQALRLLGADATSAERQTLGAMRTQPNLAVLHTDSRMMPQARPAWAAWNFERAKVSPADPQESQTVCLHYWLNKLQPLPFRDTVLVSLNPLRSIDEQTVLGRYQWEHPVFDAAAISAQRRLPELQGQRATWFCGAWCGYGFHEDGLSAGVAAAESLLASLDRASRGGSMQNDSVGQAA